jgi:hypothetical protein
MATVTRDKLAPRQEDTPELALEREKLALSLDLADYFGDLAKLCFKNPPLTPEEMHSGQLAAQQKLLSRGDHRAQQHRKLGRLKTESICT